jgi:hypothetical protein
MIRHEYRHFSLFVAIQERWLEPPCHCFLARATVPRSMAVTFFAADMLVKSALPTQEPIRYHA